MCSAAVIFGSTTAAPPAVAYADCTYAGDFGAAAGCPPPGDPSGSGGESWPPTSVDWPPAQGSGSGASGDQDGSPIVVPDGQSVPTKPTTGADASKAPAPPIVPVGSTTVPPSTTVIVDAASAP